MQNSGVNVVKYRLKNGNHGNKAYDKGSQEDQLLRLVSSGNWLPVFAEK